MFLRSILDKNSCFCQTHDAENLYILKMAGSQSFKNIGSLIDFNRLVSVEDCQNNDNVNFKKRLNVIKAQNGRHIADLV